jgi:hypothetical protein
MGGLQGEGGARAGVRLGGGAGRLESAWPAVLPLAACPQPAGPLPPPPPAAPQSLSGSGLLEPSTLRNLNAYLALQVGGRPARPATASRVTYPARARAACFAPPRSRARLLLGPLCPLFPPPGRAGEVWLRPQQVRPHRRAGLRHRDRLLRWGGAVSPACPARRACPPPEPHEAPSLPSLQPRAGTPHPRPHPQLSTLRPPPPPSEFDQNDDGRLELSELRRLCDLVGKSLNEDELREAIKLLGSRDTQHVYFTDFAGVARARGGGGRGVAWGEAQVGRRAPPPPRGQHRRSAAPACVAASPP